MAACNPDYAYSLYSAPALEPFTVEEAKAQIRSVQDQEDNLVLAYIKAARQDAETYLRRGLLTQSWVYSLSDFFDVMELPMAAPLQSVTHVKYYDENGTQQTLATTEYTVDTTHRPGRVALAAGKSWPSLQSLRKVDRVEIRYVVGWTDRDQIPADIRQGMRVLIGYLDADRDGMQTGAEQALKVAKHFWSDRVYWSPPEYSWVGY